MQKLQMKCALFILSGIIFYTVGFGQIYFTHRTPQRILLNITPEPSTSMAVTWRTLDQVVTPQVQYTVATSWIDFTQHADSADAKTEMIFIDSIRTVYHYSAIMRGLIPNTLYVYRVGSENEWSEWNQFTTASDHNAPFEFVFFGDPQEGVREFVSRIFRKGFALAPDARFWVFAGDLVPKPEKDKYWDEWFYAGNFIFSMIPSVLTPGSHEYYYRKKDRTKVNEFTKLWNAHFTLPENGVEGLEERSYYVDYQGVRLIMLDGQSMREKQSEWLATLLADNPNIWTIVAVHQPIYSMGRNRDENDTRDDFMHVFDKYGVDLVLTGHDHVYARSHALKNGNIAKNNEQGTVYVISVSGAKSYPLSMKYEYLMAKTGQNMQLVQIISIVDQTLTFKAYTVTGELYDSFELKKSQ